MQLFVCCSPVCSLFQAWSACQLMFHFSKVCLSPSLTLFNATPYNCVYQIAVEMLAGLHMALLVRPIAPTEVSLGRASRCSFRPASACVDLSFSKANPVIVFFLVTVQGKMSRRSFKGSATNHLVTCPVAYCESMRQISIRVLLRRFVCVKSHRKDSPHGSPSFSITVTTWFLFEK